MGLPLADQPAISFNMHVVDFTIFLYPATSHQWSHCPLLMLDEDFPMSLGRAATLAQGQI